MGGGCRARGASSGWAGLRVPVHHLPQAIQGLQLAVEARQVRVRQQVRALPVSAVRRALQAARHPQEAHDQVPRPRVHQQPRHRAAAHRRVAASVHGFPTH